MIMYIDIETYSNVDLVKCGLAAYVAANHFTIQLIAYAIDDMPVQQLDFEVEHANPDEFLKLLTNPGVIKIAHNAVFEMRCLERHFDITLSPQEWRCTMVLCYSNGLGSGSLAKAAEFFDTTHKKIKTTELNYFSKPATNNGTKRSPAANLPRWDAYKEYNRFDVEAERDIHSHLHDNIDWVTWCMDYKINKQGVCIDIDLVKSCIIESGRLKSHATETIQKEYGIENPKSVPQMMNWVRKVNLWETLPNIAAATVEEAWDNLTPEAQRLFELRSVLSKSSLAKYEAMLHMHVEGKLYNLFVFHGCHTGRWSGRGVQVQNLYRCKSPWLSVAREIIKQGGGSDMFGKDIISQLLRTCFVPEAGGKFTVVDLASIEARVLAWLAGEKWVLDVFSGDGLIYEAQASRMYGVSAADVDEDLRFKGKVATLALGYGGGVAALESMGMKGSRDELLSIVRRWRFSNPRICELWAYVEREFNLCMKEGVGFVPKLGMRAVGADIFIKLPSGREIIYKNCEIRRTLKWRRDGIHHKVIAHSPGNWVYTYGGKIVENIVQGIARDVLVEIMRRFDIGKIRMHIHDELVLEGIGLDEAIGLFKLEIPWAVGLPLDADGFESEFYKK